MRFLFADCALDTDARELRRSGAPVRLAPKAFELLAVLLEARPRALSKEELLARLWPDVVVAEGSLASTVAEARRALGQKRGASVVRTVHGFGYAFAGEAREEDASPGGAASRRYVVVWAGGETALAEGANVVGRDAGLPVPIDDTTVSRRHARIEVRGDEVTIVDLGSKNGTFVAGRRAEAPIPLVDGSRVTVGAVLLTFRSLAPGVATRTLGEPARES
jgi:DNA-binding winged helix-turn-helix (wHTH) protein